MKKNDVVYGLLDGCIVPRTVCSFRNWDSSCCLTCESQMVLLMSIARASGFKSMVWSQGRDGGSPFPLCCLKISW